MFTIDDIHEMLDEVAAEFPGEVFRDLNGGVSVLPQTKLSESDPEGGLYTLGEYRRDQLGRYIVIYYGSIMTVHGRATPDEMRDVLKDVLTHELTHHLESMAGERDLEIKDAVDLDNYLHGPERRLRWGQGERS